MSFTTRSAYHEVLGVPRDASSDDVRKAYKRLALQSHPDKPGGDASRFREISEAFEQMIGGIEKQTAWWDRAWNTTVAPGSPSEALRNACLAGDLEEVESLLEDGETGVNDIDSIGCTPLKYACMAGRSACVEFLLDRGATVDALSPAGVTALMEAARCGNEHSIRILLSAGAMVNHTNVTGQTALMFACVRGSLECARLLCASGADRGATTQDGRTAADYARRLKHERLAAWLEGTTVDSMLCDTTSGDVEG